MQHNVKKALVHEIIIGKMRKLFDVRKSLESGGFHQGSVVLVCETLFAILKESELMPEHRDWVLAELEKLTPGHNWKALDTLIIQLRTQQKTEKASR